MCKNIQNCSQSKYLRKTFRWLKLCYLIYTFLLSSISASDEEAELAAEEEEEEALTLQKRMAERLDEDDFFAFDKVCNGNRRTQ